MSPTTFQGPTSLYFVKCQNLKKNSKNLTNSDDHQSIFPYDTKHTKNNFLKMSFHWYGADIFDQLGTYLLILLL